MREHTKKHLTKKKSQSGSEEKSISADAYYKEVYGDFPKWATYLSGLRCRENLTQKQLGEIIGAKQNHISEMERGIRPIGKNIAQRLAKVFKTDYRKFL